MGVKQNFVVSDKSNKLAAGANNFYDVLISNAFNDFEDLLFEVTMHLMMGRYLSYVGNKKPNRLTGEMPDENYAREIMQLFSIGLWQLNDDGTRKLDESKQPIPTYSLQDIEVLA